MSGSDFRALLPLFVIAGTAVLTMLTIAFRRSHLLTLSVTLTGLALSFASLWIAAAVIPRQVTTLLIIDQYALFYLGLIIGATLVVALLSYGYFEKQNGHPDEMYLLLLLAVLGAGVLVVSNHFVSFLLGLETLSAALYTLSAYPQQGKLPLEAGIKYLILGASSAAFLIFGMALIYAQLGSMEFTHLQLAMTSGGSLDQALVLAGLALIITGIGFKLALVPFHLWTADVYEGAPAPVTAFLATVSKGSVFALLVRFFHLTGAIQAPVVLLVLGIIAVFSMIAGNVLGMLQENVKRILGYSSIAHMGYLMVAFLAAGELGGQAAAFYLVTYIITILGAFGVVSVVSGTDREAGTLDDFRGLFWREPGLGVIFTLMLLSLAGIPLTAGFIGKFYIIAAGASSATWGLIIALVLTSVLGLFYYLRVIVAIYDLAPAAVATGISRLRRPSLSERYVLAALTVTLLWVGVYPAPILKLVAAAVKSLA